MTSNWAITHALLRIQWSVEAECRETLLIFFLSLCSKAVMESHSDLYWLKKTPNLILFTFLYFIFYNQFMRNWLKVNTFNHRRICFYQLHTYRDWNLCSFAFAKYLNLTSIICKSYHRISAGFRFGLWHGWALSQTILLCLWMCLSHYISPSTLTSIPITWCCLHHIIVCSECHAEIALVLLMLLIHNKHHLITD